MNKITKEKLLDYYYATGGKKSYATEDYMKCSKLSVNEFIYISDNFENFKVVFKSLNEKLER